MDRSFKFIKYVGTIFALIKKEEIYTLLMTRFLLAFFFENNPLIQVFSHGSPIAQQFFKMIYPSGTAVLCLFSSYKLEVLSQGTETYYIFSRIQNIHSRSHH